MMHDIFAPAPIHPTKVHWPFWVVGSAQGAKIHILEPMPYPNGDWDTICGRNVNWTTGSLPDHPDLCSWCANSAISYARVLQENCPEHLYRWSLDCVVFLKAISDYYETLLNE